MQADAGGSTPRTRPLPALGTRVVVRHRLPFPDPLTGATLTDVVGELTGIHEGRMTVATRRGEVTVALADVTALKEVPPRPTRRGAPHRAVSVADLQRVMVGSWPPTETATLGQWVLRAAGGFTGRANSVMTAGDPGMPVEAAITRAEAWYAERGLPALFMVAADAGVDPADTPLGRVLREHGYGSPLLVHTLTAAAATVGSADGSGQALDVTTSPTPSDEWLDAVAAHRGADREAARAVLTGSPEQVFATARAADRVVAVGRLGLGAGWGGVGAMWVDPAHRRAGLAGRVLRALAAEATARGIRSLHLQVEADNEAATALYRRHGFEPHHTYRTLRPQGA